MSGVASSNPLSGRTVVVVGGTSGIGAAIAQAARGAGATVIVASRRSEPPLDTADPAAVADYFAALGSFDHLVLTATAPSGGRIDSIDLAVAENAFKTKYWGSFYTIRSAGPRIKLGGSITLIGGVAAWHPSAGGAVMASMNMALVPLAQVAALELAPVRVNVVSPGIIDTPNWNEMAADKKAAFFSQIAASVPAARVGAPSDVADAVMFLMKDTYVTGTVLHVEGGLLLV